jgi:hypothetical protein
MAKKVVPREELERILLEDFRKVGAKEGAAIKIQELRPPIDGANWRVESHTPGMTQNDLGPIVIPEIEARRKAEYDIIPGS